MNSITAQLAHWAAVSLAFTPACRCLGASPPALTAAASTGSRSDRLSANDRVSWFQTVQGPVIATGRRVILPHEHVFTDLRGPTVPGYGEADVEDVVRVMKPRLVDARTQGVGVLIECTGIGVRRNVPIIRRLAEESGLPIVVPTGVYGRANFAPAAHRNMTEDELATLFIREIREGTEGTGIKAGFIKAATSDSGMSKTEEKFLRAAGRAAKGTGAAAASHTLFGRTAEKEAEILHSISPGIRFIWVHAQNESSRRYHRELAARGVFIEFDALGWDPPRDTALIPTIRELVECGYADRILLSHDAGWFQPGEPNGGNPKPSTYLIESYVPKLKPHGFEEATIRRMTEANPVQAFAFTAAVKDAPRSSAEASKGARENGSTGNLPARHGPEPRLQTCRSV